MGIGTFLVTTSVSLTTQGRTLVRVTYSVRTLGEQGLGRHVTVSRKVSTSVTVHLTGYGRTSGFTTVVGTGTVFVLTQARVTVSTSVSVSV